MIITPQQTVLWNNGDYTRDVVFDSVVLSSAYGDAVLTYPFSLAVDVINNLVNDHIWFGVLLQTTNGIITVADRNVLGFCGASSHVTISGQSVPPLALITGSINKIIIRLYRSQGVLVPPPSNNTLVSLRISDTGIQTGELPFIGRDDLVLNPAVYGGVSTIATPIAPGTSTITLVSAPGSSIRYKILAAGFVLYPTPSFPGDLRGELNGGMLTAYSETDRYVTANINVPFYLINTQQLQLQVTNLNTANTYNVDTFVNYEITY